jgi:hypothetical protein
MHACAVHEPVRKPLLTMDPITHVLGPLELCNNCESLDNRNNFVGTTALSVGLKTSSRCLVSTMVASMARFPAVT